MKTKPFLNFFILSLPIITECTGIQWKSVDPGFSSSNSYQSCLDVNHTCSCDRLCSFYRDCCKDYRSDEHTTALYNQHNHSVNFDYFECRLMPEIDNLYQNKISNCKVRKSYWIISRCPSNSFKALKEQCEEEHDLNELVEVRYVKPVKDTFGNVYRNYYCAVCHNIPQNEIMIWSMGEVCHDCPETLPLSQNHFANLTSRNCNILLREPMIDTHEFFDIQLRRCDKDMVSSCPLGRNANDSKMCSQFSSPGYFKGVYFKNIFCARCHGMAGTNDWSDESLLQCFTYPKDPSTQVVDAISFSDPLCSLIRCSRPLSLCSGTGRSFVQYFSLTVNDTFRCSHLEERGERCFFQKAQLRNPLLPWKRMVGSNPLWSNDQTRSHSVTVFQLPEHISAKWRIQLDEDLIGNVIHLSKVRSCYLEYIEVVEVCSHQQWENLGECDGGIVEVQGDEILDGENEYLNEMTHNLSMFPSWYSVHTRFLFKSESNPLKRTLVCFTYPEKAEIQQASIWYRIFCSLCIAIAIVCHLATFMTYATFKSLRNTFGISLMCFVISLAIALCLLEFVADYITGITYLCKVVAICSHYFWLSSYCWMTVLAWDLHVTLSPSKMRVRQASSLKRLAVYSSFGWGLPLFIVAVCITLWRIGISGFPVEYGSVGGMSCWIYDYMIRLIAVTGPLMGCIFANIFFSLMISRSLYNYKKDSKVTNNDLTNPKRRILEFVVHVKVSMLMGFSWIFGFLADFTKIEVLWWFFYLSYLIQACLIFAFFGLSAKVRNMWKESRVTVSLAQSHSVNLEQSIK